uniref:Secreted protein n=1 Tax=Panagrellus redivivus TaxID=6233 RepID=A0A7E4VJD9_PANRE
MNVLTGILVIFLLHTIDSQAVVNCTGFIPLKRMTITPEADQTRMMNLMKVIYNPNSTLTQDQKDVMVTELISTLSCETQVGKSSF